MEFKDRLKAARRHANLNQAELAQRAGITQTSISDLERGKSKATAHVAKIAAVCGVNGIWLSEGKGDMILPNLFTSFAGPSEELTRKRVESNARMLGPIDVWDDDTPLDDDEVYVPFLKEVELSAGSGRTTVEQSEQRKLRFGKITLRRQNVQPSEAVCVTVSGNSMEPVLPDGSTVGVDQGATSVVDGKMYALNHGGQLRVKTLYRLPGGGIRMRSYNRDEHPDEEYTAQEMIEKEILVLGKVFWSSVLW